MSKVAKGKNEVAPIEGVIVGTEVAIVDDGFDYSSYAGDGFENNTSEDYALPFLNIIQSNSPIVETNALARPGMLINNATQQLYDGQIGITFIPVLRQHNMIEWKPRNQGGGYVASHSVHSELVRKVTAEQEQGRYKVIKGDPNSNELIETKTLYGIYVDEDGNSGQMVISFASTKLKKLKNWMTLAHQQQGPLINGVRKPLPLYAHKYRITTVKETNSKGSYYNYEIKFEGGGALPARLPTNHHLFQEAHQFHKFLSSSEISASYQSQVMASVQEDAEIPFE